MLGRVRGFLWSHIQISAPVNIEPAVANEMHYGRLKAFDLVLYLLAGRPVQDTRAEDNAQRFQAVQQPQIFSAAPYAGVIEVCSDDEQNLRTQRNLCPPVPRARHGSR